jgi:hypothetical protein
MSSMVITGDYILDKYFDLKNINSWGLIGALIGYVIGFRVIQYLLFSYQTGYMFKSKN